MKLKQFSVFFITIHICIYSFAQTAIRRQSDVGGPYHDGLQKLCLSTDGGFLAAGASESNHSLYKTEDSRGLYDYWVVKYDSLGKIQWDKTIGGDNEDFLNIALTTKDGGYILGGSSSSGISGEKTGSNKGFGDYWLVKLDSNGNILWDKTIGGIYDDHPASLNQTNDGGYILVGSLGLTKTDSFGNVLWQNETISSGIGYNSVQQTKDGGYLLGADTTIFISNIFASFPKLLKTDSLGNRQSDKFFSTGPLILNPGFYSAQQTRDGGVILYGLAHVDSNKVYLSSADILKTDEYGNLQWRYTTTDLDSFYGQSRLILQPTCNGDYIFGGTYQPEDVTGGVPDYIIGKLDSLGNKKWYQIISGENNDGLTDLKTVGVNSYLLGGFSSSGIGVDKTKRNFGNSDYWILLVHDTTQNSLAAKGITSSSITGKEIKEIFVYPNPAKDILHVEVNGKATLTLTDQSGKILFIKTITNKGDINVSNLFAGLYYLKNNATGQTQKLIIIK